MWGNPEWNNLPSHFNVHIAADAVARHGWLSAESTQYTGPFFKCSNFLSFSSMSIPTFTIFELSSLLNRKTSFVYMIAAVKSWTYAAMNTATTLYFSFGLFSASWIKSSVIKATCPKQSVVPRPCNLSPSIVSLNGSRFQVSGLAGTTSRWLPINDTVSFESPYQRNHFIFVS